MSEEVGSATKKKSTSKKAQSSKIASSSRLQPSNAHSELAPSSINKRLELIQRSAPPKSQLNVAKKSSKVSLFILQCEWYYYMQYFYDVSVIV